jgi:itaconate CoA-transferase
MPSRGRYSSEYQAKLCKPDAAIAAVRDDSLVIFGTGLSEPQLLLWALANRLRDGGLARLRVFSGPPGYHAADSLCSPDLSDRVERVSQFVGPSERDSIRQGLVSYLPHQFHQIPRLISDYMDVELAVTTVSPMDGSGYFTFGTNNDFISAAARCARHLIVEVNENMPRVHGDALIHIRDVDAVVENHVPLPPVVRVPPEPEDERIARSIAELVPDGATLQVGAGAIPGAVCAFLQDHRDLGIHTELMVPGLFDLVRLGAVNGSKKTLKTGKHVFTLAIGDKGDIDLLHDNPAFESHPVDYTNHPAVIAQNDRMVSINSALEMDLLGQINAESLGGYQFSGAGGQLDFVRGAFDSKGGKSILAFHSTARRGAVSRIVPRLREGTVVTTPRTDTHYVVTEFGVTNLKGKSVRERALAIIELAHPDYRDELLRASKDLHLV